MRKTSFYTKGYAKIYIQRPFFDIEKRVWKILVLKIQMVCTCFEVPSTHGSFFFKKIKISIFGGISKFLELVIFGQILLHWQWLIACLNFS
jgi:hypothetical protein